MIWVAWRQHRVSILGGLGVLVALVGYLVQSGLGLRSSFDRLGLDRCVAPIVESCPAAVSQFERATTGDVRLVLPLLLVVPALVGVFWGAPLIARELEQGTHRFAWTQSVTRRRWFLGKFGLLAAATIVGSIVTTLAIDWWAAPINAARPQQFEAGMFDLLGLAPVGYGLLALALGTASGTLTRRVLPAIALVLVLFLGVRVVTVNYLRPHYMAPERATVTFPDSGDRLETPRLPTDIGWGVSVRTVDDRDRTVSDGVGIELEAITALCPEVAEAIPGTAVAERATAACARGLGLRVVAVYQPADRFWRFQLTELAVNLALAAGLVAASLWLLRRRRA